MCKNRLIAFVLLTIFLGCGGGGEDENTTTGTDPAENQDVVLGDILADAEEEDDGTCSSGDVKCEGKKVFKCASGGLWLVTETCSGKEVCVEELGGCGCQAACDGSHCGEDGCGGLCVCPEQHVCSGVTCVCVPDCPEGMCMADGCGGTCQCPASDTCVDGECKCFPDCDGKKCGDDGCGGSCGSCSDGQLCSFDGECGYCLAEGSGTTVGETASDTVWTDSEGETFHLHSQCKSKKAILLMETAGW